MRGARRLALALDQHVEKRTRRAPTHDLATVQSDMSLLLDHFGVPIPVGDYLVDERFTHPDPMTVTQTDGAHSHPAHGHAITVNPAGGHSHGSLTGSRQRVSAPTQDADFASHDHDISAEPNHTHTATASSEATGSSGSHAHNVVRPDELRPLTPGDRVLCILLDADADAVTPYVIGRLPNA